MHLFIVSYPAYVWLVRKMPANGNGYHCHKYDNGFLLCFKDRNLFLNNGRKHPMTVHNFIRVSFHDSNLQ